MADEHRIVVQVRCRSEEKQAWQEAAKRKGVTLSEWLRELANRRARSDSLATVDVAPGPTASVTGPVRPERVSRAVPRKNICRHRVPPDAYCSRCD